MRGECRNLVEHGLRPVRLVQAGHEEEILGDGRAKLLRIGLRAGDQDVEAGSAELDEVCIGSLDGRGEPADIPSVLGEPLEQVPGEPEGGQVGPATRCVGLRLATGLGGSGSGITIRPGRREIVGHGGDRKIVEEDLGIAGSAHQVHDDLLEIRPLQGDGPAGRRAKHPHLPLDGRNHVAELEHLPAIDPSEGRAAQEHIGRRLRVRIDIGG